MSLALVCSGLPSALSPKTTVVTGLTVYKTEDMTLRKSSTHNNTESRH